MLILTLAALEAPRTCAEEQITITTYYPAPYGVYHELRAKRMVLGDNFYASSNQWGNQIDRDADLVVEGNVGIGTQTPSEKLSVAGTIESTSGGVKFPDGTIQTTAASAWVGHKWVPNGTQIKCSITRATFYARVANNRIELRITTDAPSPLNDSGWINTLTITSGRISAHLSTSGPYGARLIGSDFQTAKGCVAEWP